MSVFTIILVWLFWICYIMEILPMCWDLEILYVDVWWSYRMYILEMYDLYPLRLLRNFIYACYLNSVEHVTPISWIFALFTCIITLIEIGRYETSLTWWLFSFISMCLICVCTHSGLYAMHVCCESDSKLKKLRSLETANSGAKWCCPGPELPRQHISETYFLGQICSNFMGDTFTINIDFVSE